MIIAADFFADAKVPRDRVALPLRHFSQLADDREPWRIAFPLADFLLSLTFATIVSCEEFDNIVDWASIISIFCGCLRRSITESLAKGGRVR